MTVRTVVDPAPRLRRITLAADQFAAFAPSGPDECFGLLVPTGHRPHLRWYTVRAHRPERAEIDVDFVLHDHPGPGVEWANGAQPGDVVGFRRSGSAYRDPGPDGSQLLLADETALPALAAIVESLPAARERVRAVVELPDDSYAAPVGAHDGARVERMYRGDGPPGTSLLAAAEAAADLDYAWVCAEAAGVKAVRRHLVQAGMDRRRITFSGYWRRPSDR